MRILFIVIFIVLLLLIIIGCADTQHYYPSTRTVTPVQANGCPRGHIAKVTGVIGTRIKQPDRRHGAFERTTCARNPRLGR